MSQVLQLGQVGQFQVQRVHDSPTVDRDDADDGPAEHHQDVVGKDQVVDDGKEEEGEQTEHGKDRKGPQPRHHLLLILLWRFERKELEWTFMIIENNETYELNKNKSEWNQKQKPTDWK